MNNKIKLLSICACFSFALPVLAEDAPAASPDQSKSETPAPSLPATDSQDAVPPAATPGPAATPAPTPQANKPAAEKPKPPGFDDAVKLFSQAKYAPAAAAFEKFVKTGMANSDTHMYLGACYQQSKKYDAALKEYDWVAKNSVLISSKKKGESAAHTLRCYRAGICPGNCLKLSMPGWHRMADKDPKLLWMTFPFPKGSNSWSTNHLGEVIVYEKGEPVNKGKCTICKGTGKVPKLK